MVRLKKFIIILLILVVATFLYGDKCKAFKNIDIFNELLKITDNQILEVGLKAEYKTNNNGETECRDLLNYLNLNLNSNVLINNNQNFCIEFTKENFSGYIESILSEENNTIVINITKKTKENDLNDIEKKTRLVLEDKNVKIFKYIKAKLEETNLAKINERLLKEIKYQGASNMETLPINNGYSTISNINKVDINYVLCNYSSGDYILIGTPEIIASY